MKPKEFYQSQCDYAAGILIENNALVIERGYTQEPPPGENHIVILNLLTGEILATIPKGSHVTISPNDPTTPEKWGAAFTYLP